MTNENNMKKANTKGITLIALVVTIVVLLILAGITINYVFSEGGLFDTAKNSGNTWQNAQNSDLNELNDLNGMIGNLVNGTGSGGTTTPTEPDTPTEVSVESVTLSQDATTVYMGESLTLTATVLPENASNNNVTWSSDNNAVAEVSNNGTITAKAVGTATITVTTEDGSKTDTCTVTVAIKEEPKPLVTEESLKEIDTEKNREAKDAYGNIVVIPQGFKIAADSGTTVPEGIVIEDGSSTATTTGNQFVWIPVGKVYKSASETDFVEVKLGRYTFASNSSTDPAPGTPHEEQLAFNGDTPNYTNTDGTVGLIKTSASGTGDCSELSTSITPEGTDEKNAIAKNLGDFLTSAKNNGGYYIARYEASYGSGSNFGINENTGDNYYKPLSKKSVATNFSSSKVGSLWNHITQLEASKVSRNMYNNDENVGVESDLMNSYAWDTAIVYISQMKAEYANFANFEYNTTYGSSNNVGSKSSRIDTGTNDGDKFCNIYDMVANCWEWTTEYSNYSASPCVYRGGKYAAYFTAFRCNDSATESGYNVVFRPICYVK